MQTNNSNSAVLSAVGQNLAYQSLGLLQPNVQQTQPSQTNEAVKDTTFTKIFVGGLPYHTTDESLRIFFERFGKIEEAVVILDRSTGKSRGYGFVTMETKEGAEAAILDPNPIIDGRKANVNLAYLGVKSRVVQPTSYIPLALARYPMPLQSTAPYGLQPLYYPQMTSSAVQPAFQLTAASNLIIPSQNSSAAFSPLTSSLASTAGTSLLDLYNNQQLTSNQFLQFGSNQLGNTSQNSLSSVLTSSNSQPAASYFSLTPQNLTSFQSQ